jgi:hypothetical protein
MSKKTAQSSKQSTSEVPISTYQTRLKDQPDAVLGALDDCAELLSRVERQLFSQSQKVDTFKGKVFNQIKSFFLSFFGILSRHFNFINLALQGKVDSYRSNLKRYINENQERVDKTRKTIEKLSKKEIEPNQRQKHLNKIHQKKRRLARLEKHLEQLKSDKKPGVFVFVLGQKNGLTHNLI